MNKNGQNRGIILVFLCAILNSIQTRSSVAAQLNTAGESVLMCDGNQIQLLVIGLLHTTLGNQDA